MEEQSEYYIEIKGELFLFRDIFENIEKERLMLAEKLYKKGISTQDYKEIMTRNSQIIDKVSKFFDTKRQFIDEFLKFKGSMEMAKSSWKHEREHFFKSKEQGLTPIIGIAHLIGRDQIGKEHMQVGLKPFVRNNVLDFVDVWSLEKLKESSLNIIDVTKLSDSDEKQKEILKNT